MSSSNTTTSLTRRKSNLPTALAKPGVIQPFVKEKRPSEKANVMMGSLGNKLKEQLKA
jgi:hypothetical protein